MAIKAISHVLDHAPKDIKPAKLLLLLVLADSAGGDDWSCYPSTRYLSEKARMDQRYAKQLLGELAEEGLIEVDRFGGMKTANGFTNRYYVLIDGSRFSERYQSQQTGGNHSSPRGVNPGSPKPSVEPSVKESLTDDDIPDHVPPASRKVLTMPQPDGGTRAYSLIEAWCDGWDYNVPAARRAAHKSQLNGANTLADMGATPEAIRDIVAGKRASGKQPHQCPLAFLTDDFMSWQQRQAPPAEVSRVWREITE